MRLLVVEDDPMIGASIRTGLRQEGYTVDWVRDGDAADLATTTNDYDAILLDLGLPGKTGLELLAQWRRKQNTLPILIITARDSSQAHIHALRRRIGSELVRNVRGVGYMVPRHP